MDIVREFEQKHSNIETPVKKSKNQFKSQIKTAESMEPTNSPTINDIEALELFENFNNIVKVTEVQDEQDDVPNPYKKINFDAEANFKLNFDETSASMKKKNRPKKQLMKEGLKIRPFILVNEEKKKESSSQWLKQIKKDTNQISTPTRKPMKNQDLMRAARKQDPFRDLSNQKE